MLPQIRKDPLAVRRFPVDVGRGPPEELPLVVAEARLVGLVDIDESAFRDAHHAGAHAGRLGYGPEPLLALPQRLLGPLAPRRLPGGVEDGPPLVARQADAVERP